MNRRFSTEDFLSFIEDPDSQEIFEELFPTTSQYEYNFRIISSLLYASLAVMGFVINCFFCWIIWKATGLHRVSHMLMANMAVSNLLFLTFFSPYFLSTFILEANWILGRTICKISFSIPYVTVTGSFYFMALVALDRWLAIFHRKRRLNFSISIALTIATWTLAICVASPYIYQSDVVIAGVSSKPALALTRCGRMPTEYDDHLNMIILFFQYGIPLAIMVPAYSHLAYFLYKKQPIGKQTQNSRSRYYKRKQRLVGTLIGILIVQLLGWLPLFSVPLINKILGKWHYAPSIVCSMIALIGVTLTPICYLCNDGLNTQARDTLRFIKGQIFRCSGQRDLSAYNGESAPLQNSTTTAPNNGQYTSNVIETSVEFQIVSNL